MNYNKVFCLSFFMVLSISSFIYTMQDLKNDLQDLKGALNSLSNNLNALRGPTLLQVGNQMNQLMKESISPGNIEKYLELLGQYEKLRGSKDKYTKWFAQVTLQYFADNYFGLSQFEMIKKCNTDFRKNINFEYIWEFIVALFKELPVESALYKKVLEWLNKQSVAGESLAIMDAVLAGFDTTKDPIIYIGYPNPKDLTQIQPNPFDDKLYNNYIKAYALAKSIIGESDPRIQHYEKYLNQLNNSIGKKPR